MCSREELVEVCHRVYAKGFVAAYDGNISALNTEGNIFITRSGLNKGDASVNDILEIDREGNLIKGSGKISTENKIHLFAYKKRADVKAVVHCHPVYATAFAVKGEGLTRHVLPEIVLSLGKVPLCGYAAPSTDALHLSMEPYIEHAWAFLLRNHGAVTFGKSLIDAYYKMEKLEHTAHTLFAARLLGGETELNSSQLNELLGIAESSYGIKINERNI